MVKEILILNNELNINFTSTTYIDKQQPNSNYYKSEKLLCGSFFNSISLNSIYKSLFKFKTITLGNDKYQYASLFIYVDNFKSISNSPITILISKSLVNYNEYTVNWYSAPKSNIRDSISFEITKEDIGTYLEINITPLLSPLNATLENTSFILEPINTRTTSLVQFIGNYSTNHPYIVLYPSIKQISNLSYGATVPADLDSTDDIPNSKLSDFYSLFSQYSKKINSLETINEDQKDEIDDLKEKLTYYEESLSRIQERLTSYEASALETKENYNNLLDSLNEMSNNINSIYDSVDSTDDKITSFNEKIASLTEGFRQDNNSINDKLTSLEDVLETIQQKYTTSEDFVEIKTDLNSTIHDVSSLNQLFNENNELTNEKLLAQETVINSLNSKYASKNEITILKNSLAASTDLIDTNNDAINEKLVSVENTLNSLITKFASKNEINILKTSLAAALENINSISDSVGENTELSNRKIYNMENSLLNLDNKFASSEETSILKNSLAKTNTEINSLKNSLSTLEDSITEITSSINDNNKTSAVKISALENQIINTNKNFASIEDSNKLKAAFNSLQNNINALNSSLTENNTATSKKLAELQNSIADSDSIISASDEIASINSALNTLFDKYNSLNSLVKKNAVSSSEKFVSVENTFAAISKKYSLNSDLNELKDSVQSITEKITELINSMDQNNTSTTEKFAALETAMDNFINNYSPKKQVSNLKSSLSAAVDKITAIEGNLKSLSKIEYLNTELQKLQNDFSSFTENMNEISTKFNELAANVSSVSTKTDSHDKTFQEIGKLKSSFITLLNSMNDLKANFSIIDDKLKYISIEPFEFRDN